MPGEDQRETIEQDPLLPLEFIIPPRRPEKKRKREQGEKRTGKQTRLRFGKNKYSHCGEEGYYRKKCKNPPKQPQPTTVNTKKGGRPAKENIVTVTTKKRKYTRKVRPKSFGNEVAHDLFTEEDQIQCSNITQATLMVSYS